MLDRPDKTEDYWEARNMTGSFLEERLKKHKGFSWIRVEPMFPKFDDMSFAYKNKIFSVLIDVGYSKNENLTTQEKDRFIKECTTHNLIPCIFPIKNKKTLLSLPDDEWNLYDIRTNELVNPLVVATDEKVMMSDYEFNNMAVSIVKDYIRKEKMKFESYCDIIGIYPQIWFKDENDEMSWIYVIYSTNGKFSNVSKELDKLITGMPQFNGYIAQVVLDINTFLQHYNKYLYITMIIKQSTVPMGRPYFHWCFGSKYGEFSCPFLIKICEIKLFEHP